MALQIRRGLAADRTNFTPASGELIFTTDTKLVYIGDGSTAGGVSVGVSSGGVSDGDKGDITVSSSGTVWTIDALAVTNAKINDVAWSKVSGTPTTLAGYGISDGITSAAVAAGYQPLDSDLTAIAALTTTSFGRSLLTQADAAATRTTIGAGTSNFDGAYSSLSSIPSTFTPAAHTQAWSTITSTPTTLSGYGIVDAVALTTGKLSQFASTSSSELAGVISDETGSGALVFATSPTLVTPTLGAASATSLAMTNIVRCTEQTQTPTGTTSTLTLNDGNHQTLSLGSASGAVTATLTVPTSSAAGTVIVLQGSTVRNITWAVSSGSIVWMGTQPTWSSMGSNKSIVVAWRWNGSVMRLAASEEST